MLHLPDKDMNLEVDEEYLGKVKAVVALKISATNKKAAACFSAIDKRIKEIIGSSMKISEMAIPNTRAGYIKNNHIVKTGLITCKRCGNTLEQSVILPNGNVVLCCMDFGQKHVFGNLLRQEYDEVMNSPERKRVLAGLSDEKRDILCRGCESAISLTGDGIKGTLLYILHFLKKCA